MMMKKAQIRRQDAQDSSLKPAKSRFGPRSFALQTAENESFGREARFGRSFGETDLLPIQPKLVIGPPDDKYEQEADRVAEQVMRMQEPCSKCQVESVEEDTDSFRARPIAVQIKQSDAERSAKSTLQVYPRSEVQIRSLRGSGRPLSESTRNFFEPRFGHDFSQVRIHTGDRSEEIAQALNAQAFTMGRDIVFGAGRYTPGTSSGRELLAHELTHVVQQRGFEGSMRDAPKLQLADDATTHNDTFCPENEASDASSTNFNLREFRCRDGTDVPERFRGNVQELMDNLETLRSQLGNNPITIRSGYRTPTYNQSIGGARQSRHMCGQAADISVNGHTPTQVADTIEDLINHNHMVQGGLGRYPAFTHYDVRGTEARW